RSAFCSCSSQMEPVASRCPVASCHTTRMIKAIFWDNDGVLVETEHLYFEATQQVLRSVGIDLTEEQYIELFLVQGRGAWHLAEERGIAPSDIERLRHERNEVYT